MVIRFLLSKPTWVRLGLTGVILAGFLMTVPESKAQFSGDGKKGKGVGQSNPEISKMEAGNPDFVQRMAIGQDVFRGIVVHNGQPARDRGMLQTGLTPKFDEHVYCSGIDDFWAQDYSQRMGGESMHGGIDIPVPFGTPVHAIADGEVVEMSLHEANPDGIQIWLRHSPTDTGLPMWTFSQYAHLEKLPDFSLGQHVRIGDVVGITSNTGISAGEKRAKAGGASPTKAMTSRRPAIHFAVIYNSSGKYFRDEQHVVPLDGWWMDPNAIYRKAAPFDSVSMKALPEDQKQIPIPYMLPDGTKVPATTKVVWPYPCSPTPLPSARRNPSGLR